MKTAQVTVHDKEGLHARPAGVLNKAAKEFACSVTLSTGEKQADLKRLFAVMGLAVKGGDTLTLTCDGPDEDAAFDRLSALFASTLS